LLLGRGLVLLLVLLVGKLFELGLALCEQFVKGRHGGM
jgi:hypothetical protein